VAQRFSAAIRDILSVPASAAEVPLGLKPVFSSTFAAGLEGLRHPKSSATWEFFSACKALQTDP